MKISRRLWGIWLALAGGLSCAAWGAPPSLLIHGGVVVDGTGAKGRAADVRVQGENIVAVGRLKPLAGERVLNAAGLTIAPGFIDTHSHADGGLLDDPDAEGDDPAGNHDVGASGRTAARTSRSRTGSASWRRSTSRSTSPASSGRERCASRCWARTTSGRRRRPRSAKMQALVAQEMDAGALGLSTGLEYDPGFYSTTANWWRCRRSPGRHGGLYISHVRDEGDKVFDSFRELITIGQRRASARADLPHQAGHDARLAQGRRRAAS